MLRPRPASSETRPESALTPREIQSRLRAGETADDVARAAGIPVARVARYEAPIAAERVRIVDEVRRTTAPGPHRAAPGALGSVIDSRLADDGLDPALAQWLARRRQDGTWLVTVDLADHHAEWSWDAAARRVRANDSGAQRLLSPSRSSAESLIAVAQAAGVTAESAGPSEPPSPIAPARAVGESLLPTHDASGGRSISTRSSLVVLAGEGTDSAAAAATTARASAPAAPTIDEIPGSGGSAPAAVRPSWTPSAADVPGASTSNPLPYQPTMEPSASADDGGDNAGASPAAVDVTDPAVTGRPGRTPAKAGRRRSAVPAWDDIVFGARRP
jgi:hypothetical protein